MVPERKKIRASKAALLLLALSTLPLATAAAQNPWGPDLVRGGTDYWHTRFRVEVTNPDALRSSAAGLSVTLVAGPGNVPLQGTAAEGVRVLGPSGKEHLFFLGGPSGRRTGPVAVGDVLEFSLDAVAAGASATYWIYAGNPTASDVDECLPRFANGDLEQSDQAGRYPEGWLPANESDLHQAIYLDHGGRTAPRCVTLRIAPGAPPQWVGWQQAWLRVLPNHRYRLEGYLRHSAIPAGGVAGIWIHRYDSDHRDILPFLEQNLAGDSGGAWQRLALEFDSSADLATISVGGVLMGTGGEAWFDDFSLTETPLPGSHPLQVTVSPPERLELMPELGGDAWAPPLAGDWRVRVDVRVRSAGPPVQPSPTVLALADLNRAVHMLRRLAPASVSPYTALVVDPVRGSVQPSFWVNTTQSVVFAAVSPGLTEKRYFVYLSPAAPTFADQRSGYHDLVRNPDLNLVANPDLEEHGALPGWNRVDCADGSALCRVAEDSSGPLGPRCLMVSVQPGAPPGSPGWHQVDLPVRPGQAYVYAAAAKLERVAGPHHLGGGYRTPGGWPGVACWGPLNGTRDWAIESGLSRAPLDADVANLNLCMIAADVSGTVWYDGILFAPVTRVQPLDAQVRPDAPARALSVWSVNPLVKIFPDDPAPAAMLARGVFGEGARNEREVIQIALRTAGAAQVSVEVSPLALPSGQTLPAVEVFQVGIVPVDRPTYGIAPIRQPSWMRPVYPTTLYTEAWYGGLTDGWAGWWPDPLIPAAPGEPVSRVSFPLEGASTRSVWLRIGVPRDALAGEYQGTVTVRSGTLDALTFPLHYRVWGFALPERPRLQATIAFEEVLFLAAGDLGKVKDLYRFLAGYRVSPGFIRPEPSFVEAGPDLVSMDADDYLELASLCFDELGMAAAFSPTLFVAQGWAWPLRNRFGRAPRTPHYEALMTSAYGQFAELLSARGWGDRFTTYLTDEPFCEDATHGPRVVADLTYVANLYKAAAPKLPIYASTWSHFRSLDGVLTHWGAGHHGVFPVSDLRERTAAGDKLWFTTDGHFVLDTPLLAIERLLPTYCFAYGVGGYEFWSLTFWTNDPWQLGSHRFTFNTFEGVHLDKVQWPNGDGYLAYPGRAIGRDGLVGSIRLETVRDGVDDFDYFSILSDLIAAHPERDLGPALAVLEEVRSLVSIPNSGGARSLKILPDPDAVPALRRRVAQQILRLSEPPQDGGQGREQR